MEIENEIISKILKIGEEKGFQEIWAILQILEKRREIYKHESHMNGKVDENSYKLMKFNSLNYIINSVYEQTERDILKV